MKSLIIKAPAKINLYLDVINKRPDGYHNIETIFEKIDLCDWIRISVIKKGIKILCDHNRLTKGAANTARRAAMLLTESYNLRCGFKIQIDKRIPVAAGLGGGSSDAASVLLGINNLLGLGIKKYILLKLAAKIGADVPFFASGYNRALATGIGEMLLPLKQKHKLHFLLVVPNVEILTYTIYNRLKVNPNSSREIKIPLTKKESNANIFCHYFQDPAAANIRKILYNKLEEVVLPSYPVLCDIKEALDKAGAEGVLVSGSGSAVYGIFRSRKEAVGAQDRLAKKGNWQLFLTRSY